MVFVDELGDFHPEVHFDSLARGRENLSFEQNILSIDLSKNYSLENIALNYIFPEHMDTKFASVSDTRIVTRDTFWEFYFDNFYLLMIEHHHEQLSPKCLRIMKNSVVSGLRMLEESLSCVKVEDLDHLLTRGFHSCVD